ncbi:hypothetical protein ARMGADRAFT_617109 [Armillaria gallica]|uniref:Uncharacterized protein n=1 Tax=Armillaria gallica TaxID=47427 RepID=A0A2H3CLZ1_ARMGA|nr:hypothetical protein ARMGADRAFT_617109 [Armillaria gallica]
MYNHRGRRQPLVVFAFIIERDKSFSHRHGSSSNVEARRKKRQGTHGNDGRSQSRKHGRPESRSVHSNRPTSLRTPLVGTQESTKPKMPMERKIRTFDRPVSFAWMNGLYHRVMCYIGKSSWNENIPYQNMLTLSSQLREVSIWPPKDRPSSRIDSFRRRKKDAKSSRGCIGIRPGRC